MIIVFLAQALRFLTCVSLTLRDVQSTELLPPFGCIWQPSADHVPTFPGPLR